MLDSKEQRSYSESGENGTAGPNRHNFFRYPLGREGWLLPGFWRDLRGLEYKMRNIEIEQRALLYIFTVFVYKFAKKDSQVLARLACGDNIVFKSKLHINYA